MSIQYGVVVGSSYVQEKSDAGKAALVGGAIGYGLTRNKSSSKKALGTATGAAVGAGAKRRSEGDREALRQTVRTIGLKAPVPDGRTLQDLGQDILNISRAGLRSRAKLSVSGDDETGFLQELDRTIETGKTPAEELLQAYFEDWDQDASKVFKELAY